MLTWPESGICTLTLTGELKILKHLQKNSPEYLLSTYLGRSKLPAQLLHVLPLLNSRQNRRIGRRTADPALFQLLHKRSLVVSRRRLGEMLLRLQLLQRELLPRFQRRQLVLEFLVLFVLAFLRLLVKLLQEAVERAPIVTRNQNVSLLPLASMSTVVWSNTAGIICESHKTLPDQLVNFELIFL